MKKFIGLYMILGAVALVVVDFLTLGNRNLIDNQITNPIAFVIAMLCVLVFLFGIIKTLHDFFARNREANKIRWKQEEEQGIRASGVEIGLRRFLAILLIISVAPMILLAPLLGWIVSLPSLLLALYLLLNHRYHLVFDGIIVIFGGLAYFSSFVGTSYLSLYKSIELSTCPGLIGIKELLITNGILGLFKYLLLSAPLFLFTGDIIARFKPIRKGMLSAVSLIIIFTVLFILPFLYIPGVSLGGSTNGGTGGGTGPLQHFAAFNTQFNMSYDKVSGSYTFTAEMPNQDTDNSSSITNICVDAKLIPITDKNSMLQIEGAVIADGKISVPPGQTAVIKLVSQKPFYVISLFEGEFHYLNSFLK